jgi:hypothetical protein
MGFYNLTKEERIKRVGQISNDILSDIKKDSRNNILTYFSDEGTPIGNKKIATDSQTNFNQ